MTEAPDTVPLSEIEALQGVVGIEPRDRLEWAIKFAQEADPRTSGEWLTLRMAVYAFASSLVWWDRIPKGVRHALQERYTRGETRLRITLPSKDVVRKIRDKFRSVLEAFEKTGHYTQELLRTIHLNISIPQRKPSEDVLPLHQTELEEWTDRLRDISADWRYPPHEFDRRQVEENALTHFLDLLAGPPGEFVRICPEQHPRRIFVASRLNQNFCQTKCQNRAAQRDLRSRKE